MPPTDPADIPKIIQIAEGFYVRQEIDNLAWIDLGDGALVVDALEHPEKGEEVFAAIDETLGGKPVRYVLNTHTHYDHVALNGAFEQQYGAKIISATNTDIPAEGLWFEGPARRVQMVLAPGCHTREDCLVWVPSDKALFVGDIFGWGLIPLTNNLRPEIVRNLLETYQRLIDYDATIVLPGHGPLCTPTELARWAEYFRQLARDARAAIAEGKSDEQILRDTPPPQDMQSWWRFAQWKHGDSVAKVVKAARKGWLDEV
jgi:cyclase